MASSGGGGGGRVSYKFNLKVFCREGGSVLKHCTLLTPLPPRDLTTDGSITQLKASFITRLIDLKLKLTGWGLMIKTL